MSLGILLLMFCGSLTVGSARLQYSVGTGVLWVLTSQLQLRAVLRAFDPLARWPTVFRSGVYRFIECSKLHHDYFFHQQIILGFWNDKRWRDKDDSFVFEGLARSDRF